MSDLVPTTEVLQGWAEACLTEGRHITSWEAGFLASVRDSLDHGWSLSFLQIKTLKRIYAEKTPC